ncbi:MAG TPA: FGGY family carbohydrate kinase, partial [Clostridia bacterium]|nr:FGGY family carbohydrate kinase [Clostridia bacterium]
MYFLGVDIGTTGAKALLTDEKGAVLGKGHETYRLVSKGSNVEQNADDWIKGSITAIRQAIQNVDSSSVAAISLSAQGASTVALDSQNRPLGNALTWMDMRASAEANELAEALGEDYIYSSTGWRINAALDAAKIMHMKRQKAYSGAVRFLSTLEYMNNFLTNNPVGDPSTASIRQLYSVREHKYDDAILDAAGILSEELPKIIPTGVLIGGLTELAARET